MGSLGKPRGRFLDHVFELVLLLLLVVMLLHHVVVMHLAEGVLVLLDGSQSGRRHHQGRGMV